ncbi:MAG: hypothetical protein ACHQK8_07305 [Bacteroidia bacterium]
MKRIILITILLTVITLFSSCNGSHKNFSGVTLLEGRIDPFLAKNKKIYFYELTDSMSLFFFEKQITDSCLIDEHGNFKFELKHWNKPGFFDLGTLEAVFIKHIFAEPGDKIELFFDGKDLPLTLDRKNNIGTYNEFLQLFYDTFYRSPEVKKYYYVTSNFLMAPEYARYQNSRRNQQIQFFEKYFEGKKADSIFKNCFISETNLNWADDKLYFLWKKRIRKEVVPVDSSYFDFLKAIDHTDRSALICPGFSRYINFYIRELYQELPLETLKENEESMDKCNLAKKNLKGLGLKIAYYLILRDELNNAIATNTRFTLDTANINRLTDIAVQSTGDASYKSFVKNYQKH